MNIVNLFHYRHSKVAALGEGLLLSDSRLSPSVIPTTGRYINGVDEEGRVEEARAEAEKGGAVGEAGDLLRGRNISPSRHYHVWMPMQPGATHVAWSTWEEREWVIH